jgi:hypothetical protein
MAGPRYLFVGATWALVIRPRRPASANYLPDSFNSSRSSGLKQQPLKVVTSRQLGSSTAGRHQRRIRVYQLDFALSSP